MYQSNKAQPLISVIMPVYNAQKTLEASTQSVLTQSYSNLELILVNDGSKDESLALCHKIAKQDQRVKVISQANGGPAKARNAALDYMQGEYVMFADSDDRLSPGACQSMMDAIMDHDLVIGHYFFEIGKSSTDRGLLKGNRELTEREFLMELMQRPGSFYFSALWNKLYRADLIRELGLQFDPFLDWGEDFAFNMQYYHGVHSAAVIDFPVYHYIKNPGGASIRSLIHIFHSCKIKWRLYQHFKGLYVKKGLYAANRFKIHRYIYNVTLAD